MIKLKKWQRQDARLFYELSHCSRIYQNMNDSFPQTIEAVQTFIDDLGDSDENNECVRKIIWNGQVVGCIGIFINDSYGELAYWLSRQYWGQGLMSETIDIFIEMIKAKYQIQSIIATPFIDNIASQRVLEKSGFMKYQILKNHVLKDHQYIDCQLYVLNIEYSLK